MSSLFYRTEDIPRKKILDFFVKTAEDDRIVQELKSLTPVVLVGSRGVGKSFLLRVAQQELAAANDGVIPVYLTFNQASLIQTSNSRQFQHWMLARLCSRILRAVKETGRLAQPTGAASILAGGNPGDEEFRVSAIAKQFEESWKSPGVTVDIDGLPDMDDFRDAMEDLCDDLGVERFVVFFDEAAHIFRPAQQREFFALFRDLRSPHLTCKAAVYPGVTSYGDAFQPVHDATFLTVDRDILNANYVENMREIVERQADDSLLRQISKSSDNFSVLAYAASGNPRLLLKTIAKAPKLSSSQVNETVKGYYRTDMWSEHSGLAAKYAGHTALVDWGRNFLEQHVIPEIKRRNDLYLEQDKKTTAHFWIHRDAPHAVIEALRLLAYTGIVTEDKQGIKATRGEIGTRYRVNLGCLLALESAPARTGTPISENITPRRVLEFGANHDAYLDLLDEVNDFSEVDASEIFSRQLEVPVTELDLTPWQKDKLQELGLGTIGDVLRAGEVGLKKAYYVGEKRARRMWNAAVAATLEYLSG